MVKSKKIIQDRKDKIIQTRRDLHKIPELAFKEKKTSSYIINFLEKEGFSLQTGIASTGVVAMLNTGKPGPNILFRADMDAVPVDEKTGLAFSSTHSGAAHVCGHDAHTTMVLHSAAIIKFLSADLKGKIRFVFQPAEESTGGAKPMLDTGFLGNDTVDYALACHLQPEIPAGQIGLKGGALMAAPGRFEVTIRGIPGHAATPHLCNNPVDTAIKAILAFQELPNYICLPTEPCIVRVCAIHGGKVYNAIPEEVKFFGTTRTFNESLWLGWENIFEKILKGICQSNGTEFILDYHPNYPPVINDQGFAEVLRKLAIPIFGQENITEFGPTMLGEDMSHFIKNSKKGCLFFLGVGNSNCKPLHSPFFNFDETLMLKGIEVFVACAQKLMK